MATITGTAGNDTLNGTSGGDTIFGLGGNDRLFGHDGGDRLYGGDGDDYLNPGGNTEADSIDAGNGNDVIDFTGVTTNFIYNISHYSLTAGITVTVDSTANTGFIDKGVNGTTTLINVTGALSKGLGVRLSGTAFDDVFNVNPGDNGSIRIGDFGGNDTIYIGSSWGDVFLEYHSAISGVTINLATGLVSDDGRGGSDTITGPGHVTVLETSHHNDLVIGSGNDEDIRLLDGADTVYARGGNDTLSGMNGNDRLYGGDGIDSLFGGDGDDYLNPGGSAFWDNVDAGIGDDIVDLSDLTDNEGIGLSHSSLNGLGHGISVTLDYTTNTGIVDKGGTNGTTTFLNLVNGWVDISGTDYADTFHINPGDDGGISIKGGQGADSYEIDASIENVKLDFKNGTGGVTANLKTGVIADDGFGNRETITGTGADSVDNLRSSMFDDDILGSSRDETFELMAGNDALNGRGGIDLVRYDRPGIENVIVDLTAGTATGIWNSQAFSHTLLNIENVTGSRFEDTILRGSAGANELESRGGKDVLAGRGGDDTLIGGDGNDRLNGGAGNDILIGDGIADYFIHPGVPSVNKGKDILKGGAGNDILNGGAKADVLNGGRGSDTLDGGRGNDRMTGGKGNDTFVFGPGKDVITDFNAVNIKEKIDLSKVASITGFKDLKNHHLSEAGGNVIIDGQSGNTLTLNGLTIAELDKGDFIF